jgi:predicted DNA-binding transcriptional regulator YafY
MARGDQLARQWRIIETLIASHGGKSAAELAAEIDCHPRTVYRDLDALQAAGFPLYTERSDGKSLWSILDALKHHIPIPFSFPELMALYFSRDLVKALQHTVFYDSLESLFGKIKSTIPPESAQFLQTVQQTLHVSTRQYKEYGKFRDIISRVSDAALKARTVEMSYFTMGRRKESKRRVDPYRILFFNGTFYIIGFCHLRGDIRTFALDRVKTLRVTEDTFTVPDDFSLEDYMGAAFGVVRGKAEDIRIRFAPDVAGYVSEKHWHESQEITRQRDGSVIFSARVAVTEELVSWVMGWGAKAEVIGPESLRDQIRDEAQAMLKPYSRPAKKKKPPAG